jgi:hypothetical protein
MSYRHADSGAGSGACTPTSMSGSRGPRLPRRRDGGWRGLPVARRVAARPLRRAAGRHRQALDVHQGRRRQPHAGQPDDLVHREISRALRRPDVQVIPVLVGGAHMPAEHELPADLAPLSRRQACELTDSRWECDVDTLAPQLRDLLGEKPHGRSWRLWPVGTGVVAAALTGAGLLASAVPHGIQCTSRDAGCLAARTIPLFGQAWR